MSLQYAKRVVAAERSRFVDSGSAGAESGGESEWRKTQMFLPVASEGKPVIKVTTRQDFLNFNIGFWRAWQLTRVGAAIAGAAAIWLFFSNQYILAGGAALLAGWWYGEHVRRGFYMTKLLRKRYLLEGT